MCDLSYLQRKSSRVENYRNLSYNSFPPTVLPRESDYDFVQNYCNLSYDSFAPTEKHMLEVKK